MLIHQHNHRLENDLLRPHTSMSSAHERLVDLAKMRREARALLQSYLPALGLL